MDKKKKKKKITMDKKKKKKKSPWIKKKKKKKMEKNRQHNKTLNWQGGTSVLHLLERIVARDRR